ncbi:MAG: hypothetical protein WA139_03040 [Candidatus Aenigmatarchaeota archaeon]
MNEESVLAGYCLPDSEIKELMKNGVITNGSANLVEQSGVDLTLYKIYGYSGPGFIGKNERILPEKKEIEPVGGKYELMKGKYYDIIFNEGCKFPNNISAIINPKSSTNRCGTWVTRRFLDKEYTITSGFYDPGYKADHIAALLIVNNDYDFKTETGAPLAKMMFFKSLTPVIKSYNKKRTKSSNGEIATDGCKILNMQKTMDDF